MKPTQWTASVRSMVLFVALFLAGTVTVRAAQFAPARTIQGIAFESATVLDVLALNERIKTVAAPRRALMASPIPLVHELIGGGEETPRVFIELRSEAGDDFSRVTVTVTRDGFQDDSLRGDWHEFMLSRDAGGGWTVVRARMAMRCWRGRVDVYAARKCG